MPSVSSGANQLFSRIDTDRNGVSKLELQKLDQDGDGKISQQEVPELRPEERALVNQYLSDSSSPNTVVFELLRNDPDSASQSVINPGPGPAAISPEYNRQQRNEFLQRQAEQNGPTPPPGSVPGAQYQSRGDLNAIVPDFGAPAARPASRNETSQGAADGELQGVADGTGYYPANNAMEGGFVDKQGRPLCTLQDFLEGKSDYVSIALDKNLYKNGSIEYGDTFRIPELEAKYGRQIVFKAVDTGGAFTNKGFGRVDICTRSEAHSLEPTLNGRLSLIKTS